MHIRCEVIRKFWPQTLRGEDIRVRTYAHFRKVFSAHLGRFRFHLAEPRASHSVKQEKQWEGGLPQCGTLYLNPGQL